ncbi:MAG TPA: gluconate 2-dehydrogenase subunit 3 family protein [Puia sp.]|jgi:hypothetical protein|nr:gluconate 2-dehydrogenase subunit 3 family protein [Puia sp.]
MNRRKAIGRIALTGIGGALLLGSYKWYDWTRTPDINYAEQHKELITALAATIIPATDTPGAREAGVGDFIVTMIRDCTDRMSANKFIDGLKDLGHYCQSHFDKPYEQCSEPDKQAVLHYFEEKGTPYKGIVGKAQDAFLGRSFFATLKKYTVEGYCSSEIGAAKGLRYDYIPGSYHGCIPLQPGQKAWATR